MVRRPMLSRRIEDTTRRKPIGRVEECALSAWYDAAMSAFPGGSAYAMVNQVADGFLLVTERTFKRMQRPDLDKLNFEIDKLLREIRGNQADTGDVQETQKRNRRLQRLNTCRMMLRAYRMKQRI